MSTITGFDLAQGAPATTLHTDKTSTRRGFAMTAISQFLNQDHSDLDARFDIVRHHAGVGDWAAARMAMVRFARALREHIAMEQQLLFPALIAVADVEGPCRVMRQEHDEINRLLELLYTCCADQEALAFNVSCKQLRDLLRSHNDKEEHILYPLADQVLQASALQLVAEMRGVRAQTGSCGGSHCGCGHAA